MTAVDVVKLAGEISARAAEADRLGKLPADDVRDLIESGYLALPVPREYGGSEASFQEVVRAHLELSKGSASTALVAAMTLHLFGHGREARPYTENCFAEMSRRVLDGALFNVVASEPAMGSPSRGHFYATTAARDENGNWLVNGHK